MYYDHKLEYPSSSAPDGLGTTNFACLNSNGWATSGCSGTVFMQRVPLDPQSASSRHYIYTRGGSLNNTFTITYYSEASGATATATESSMN